MQNGKHEVKEQIPEKIPFGRNRGARGDNLVQNKMRPWQILSITVQRQAGAKISVAEGGVD